MVNEELCPLHGLCLAQLLPMATSAVMLLSPESSSYTPPNSNPTLAFAAGLESLVFWERPHPPAAELQQGSPPGATSGRGRQPTGQVPTQLLGEGQSL